MLSLWDLYLAANRLQLFVVAASSLVRGNGSITVAGPCWFTHANIFFVLVCFQLHTLRDDLLACRTTDDFVLMLSPVRRF